MQKYKIPVVIEKDENGFFAFCPTLQGCYAQGDTFEEVIENITDAIRLHILDRLAEKEEIPEPQIINLTMVEVSV
ncbi:MAG: type II toxin-antitoxin system HicB family antitoxin [Candidatus Odinarchaeota archaeon]|nr:type II toxin-antitoxin system HicB family antitoxin [Candidatus Odinarchaeota archaeon]